ncbi:MAG: hypothetical protein LWW77_05155 [Propionibacteriales bacterium]|nr:hypothetical protein [Propionibacteriales bacterium]
MRLFLAELLRFWSRRMVWVAIPVLIVLTAATAVPAAMLAFPTSAADQAQAQADYQQEYQQWQTDCAGPDADPDCDLYKPTPADFERTPSSAADAWQLALSLKGGLGTLLYLLIGVSFVAAEFRAGTISTWLTFNPNRYAVYATKLGAAALSLGAAAVLALAAQMAVFVVMLTTVGVAVDTSGFAVLLGWNFVGAALLTSVAVAIGMIFRHTVAGLAIAIGVNFLEGIAQVALMFAGGGWSRLGQYLPGTQLNAVFGGGASYVVQPLDGAAEAAVIPITPEGAALYWTILAVAFTAVGVLSLTRREVR